MDTFVILVLCLSVLFMSGVIFGVYALMNRAVGVPKRKALKAQKVRAAALTNAMADLTLALTKDALVAVPGIGPERYRDLYQLEQQNILDPEHDNHASIDVAAQRAAWVGSGKAEAAEWDDATVRSNPFKRNVYLAGDVKILGSMVNLEFVVSLQ